MQVGKHRLLTFTEKRGNQEVLVIRALTGTGIVVLPDSARQVAIVVTS